MAYKQKRLPEEVFDSIYGTVPRLTVEVIVRSEEGVILTQRGIEPCKGQWHIPGGTVFFLARLWNRPFMLARGCQGWPVGVAFEVAVVGGTMRGSGQGQKTGVFTDVPDNTIAEQAVFLKRHVFLATQTLFEPADRVVPAPL